MNYQKINWSTKTALSKDDLATMDNGIAACAESINKYGTALKTTADYTMVVGSYYFTAEDTDSTANAVKKKEITYGVQFKSTPLIFATVNTSRPDVKSASVGEVGTGKFNLYLNYKNGTPTQVVYWMAIGQI